MNKQTKCGNLFWIVSIENGQIQREELGALVGAAVTRFPLVSICPAGPYGSVTLCGRWVYGRLVTVSSRVVKRQLLLRADVPSGKQRQSRNYRVHTDRHHEQVGLTAMVEKAAYVPHRSRVHKSLHNGARTRVLPHSDDVIIFFRSLGKLSASGLCKTDDLSCILAYKCPMWD